MTEKIYTPSCKEESRHLIGHPILAFVCFFNEWTHTNLIDVSVENVPHPFLTEDGICSEIKENISTKNNNKHMGSTFDSFLEEEGIKDEVEKNAGNETKLERQLYYIWERCGSHSKGFICEKGAHLCGGDESGCYACNEKVHNLKIEIGLGHVFKKFESLGIKIGDVILSAHGTGITTFTHNGNCTEFTDNGSFLIAHDDNGDFAKIRDQSPETIEEIAKLMGWVDEQ